MEAKKTLIHFFNMIARIVHLYIHPKHKEDFLQMFEGKKSKIRSFEGCKYLNLLECKDENPEYFHVATFSHWISQEYLDNYRKSDVFGQVWPQTKKWFAKKPEAQSFEVLELLD